MWGEITYPFPNFNGVTVEVWERINSFTPHFSGKGLLTHVGLKLIHVSKKGFSGSKPCNHLLHYNDVIMGTMASQITSFTIVYSTVYSGIDQRKHQSSASLAFVRGIHRRPVNSPHKGPVTRKMFPFDDVIMILILFMYDIYLAVIVIWLCICLDPLSINNYYY